MIHCSPEHAPPGRFFLVLRVHRPLRRLVLFFLSPVLQFGDGAFGMKVHVFPVAVFHAEVPEPGKIPGFRTFVPGDHLLQLLPQEEDPLQLSGMRFFQTLRISHGDPDPAPAL